MCVMLDMPPAMEQEAKDFATVQGITLERMLLDCLKRELARRKEAEEWEAEFDRLVESSSLRLTGEKPYKFHRADAYPADLNDGQIYGSVKAVNPFKDFE